MKAISLASPVLLSLALASCTTTKGYRHKDQTITVSQRGLITRGDPTNYWIVGAKPNQVTSAENLSVYRKTLARGSSAAPLKCSGFVDTTRSSRIEVQLAEKHGGSWQKASVNGAHKLVDETAPKPFYHWLIP
ncbi:hypothetical protein [Luteolibacter luteus]|uniref:Lipoprotein n=1 Tax=Luteolibacter luteus TaxID=2728835 RepID=A0A858RS24_9BACT|nr:hypothetical protein [Luteolibacter luteus]QJE98743.1 hypothetical protein HHL09_24175 [Luteolibacter luteus]